MIRIVLFCKKFSKLPYLVLAPVSLSIAQVILNSAQGICTTVPVVSPLERSPCHPRDVHGVFHGFMFLCICFFHLTLPRVYFLPPSLVHRKCRSMVFSRTQNSARSPVQPTTPVKSSNSPTIFITLSDLRAYTTFHIFPPQLAFCILTSKSPILLIHLFPKLDKV